MAAIHELLRQISDDTLRTRLENEIKKLEQKKKFGLVFEEHLPECTPLHQLPIRIGSHVAKKSGRIVDIYTVVSVTGKEAVCHPVAANESEIIPLQELVTVATFGDTIFPSLESLGKVKNAPESGLWHTLIEADNYHALQLLEYLYPQKVDCIYIDPPYNTGAKDWKYNNDYVDGSDAYRHSKWLSMMQKRLELAKKILNPSTGVLIVTIDEHEVHHLRDLLEEIFPETYIQMVTVAINPKGSTRGRFSRVEEYILYSFMPNAFVFGGNDPMLGDKPDEDSLFPRWKGLLRSGEGSRREDSKNLFFPVLIDEKDNKIIKACPPIPWGISPNYDEQIEGYSVAWPIKSNGEEGRWMLSTETFNKLLEKGYISLGRRDKKRHTWGLSYLSKKYQEDIDNGILQIVGHSDNGQSVIVKYSVIQGKQVKTMWHRTSHDAGAYGSDLLSNVIGRSRTFSFPKSLYVVKDSLAMIVSNKPNALIVDFFAGSGTTLHAVNLLNAEDGGNRRCILVTNNEVSESEAKKLTKEGHQPGDEKWERLGIARYVTWPRTVCSIEGHDVNGNPLKGNYLGSDRPMSEGFPANAEYFKLGFLDKDSVSLGAQFREILPLLWLKAGSVGERPELPGEDAPPMLILPKNDFAVLLAEGCFGEFMDRLGEIPKLSTIYLVTDSEELFRNMAGQLGEVDVYQLYRDYIDNFILGARNRGNEA